MTAGPRFTAEMGQDVCMRIRELEKAANLTVKDCSYYVKSKQ